MSLQTQSMIFMLDAESLHIPTKHAKMSFNDDVDTHSNRNSHQNHIAVSHQFVASTNQHQLDLNKKMGAELPDMFTFAQHSASAPFDCVAQPPTDHNVASTAFCSLPLLQQVSPDSISNYECPGQKYMSEKLKDSAYFSANFTDCPDMAHMRIPPFATLTRQVAVMSIGENCIDSGLVYCPVPKNTISIPLLEKNTMFQSNDYLHAFSFQKQLIGLKRKAT
ncbi:hypothetical protein BATDEDRAFT_22476 [Batrachochytrium dendrobatidis JAM81]|uniref:Uncharacterized protein n=2 Tax=Batrachochytrium dendrobatidis TaxID=109871 RepID=F4NUR6_BATDJ|nr:uncharacterized protein BATDEDRAFT_22476 [Batrachochytrium dendrobatidis JAM81]EGF84431.1 hypothetical protein BATDEDRAFT_22476 [Batrachochytrium dendrobatidis JAM81]KAJ8327383.1 hypothetical protein O5D80_004772 [Batrachochytrium dendrobatidis]KAK5665229.1 hypothetical protein QVD99_008075 [Batrachochytrium dendrobatidis]OAJ37486.1 hypothetical protein BDEG_21500 [Batrachochytrium dendrobatidis JEL423]|eukprot:XP_006675578.1 hypothetical protein BATDEDRAFT_22476 [Batrachochytrium dendrobatidis JAM81]